MIKIFKLLTHHNVCFQIEDGGLRYWIPRMYVMLLFDAIPLTCDSFDIVSLCTKSLMNFNQVTSVNCGISTRYVKRVCNAIYDYLSHCSDLLNVDADVFDEYFTYHVWLQELPGEDFDICGFSQSVLSVLNYY